jgi:hypothetical protein
MTARVRHRRVDRHLRIARPASDITRTARMYCAGLDMAVLGSFEDHDGFDGIMVGAAGGAFHLEFTHCRHGSAPTAPGAEDLLVFYVASARDWSAVCARMLAAGFEAVAPANPYWERRARTFRDADGYRVVIHRGAWLPGGADAEAPRDTPDADDAIG